MLSNRSNNVDLKNDLETFFLGVKCTKFGPSKDFENQDNDNSK